MTPWLGDRGVDGDPCSRPVRTAYAGFVRELARRGGASTAYGWRVDPDETHVHAVAAHNLPPGMRGIRTLARTAPSVEGDCLRGRHPVLAGHATAERRYPLSAALMQQVGARALLALPVRGERLHGIVSLALHEEATPASVTDLQRLCDGWSAHAKAAEEEERLLEDEAWRSACAAAGDSLDAGLEQVVRVLADAARFLPRKGNAVRHERGGHALDLPAPRDGLEPHRQAHLHAEPARPLRAPESLPRLHSMMDVPVLHGGVLVGHLQFARSGMHGCFTTRHLDWAQEFAKCVAVGLRSGSR